MIQEEAWHRRHAILPEKPEDALIVLRAATRLVVDFMIEDDPAPIASKVFTLVRDPA